MGNTASLTFPTVAGSLQILQYMLEADKTPRRFNAERSVALANCSDVSTHQQLTRRRPIGMGAPLVPAIRVHRTSWRVVLVGLEHRASCRPVLSAAFG